MELTGPLVATPGDFHQLDRLWGGAVEDASDDQRPVACPDWSALLERDGPGLRLWRDLAGGLVGFVHARRWGTEAAVLTSAMQAGWPRTLGIGHRMIGEAADWLLSRGAQSVGIEVPPDPEGHQELQSIGFAPVGISTTYTWVARGEGDPFVLPSLPASRCQELVDLLKPGLDVRRDLDVAEAGGTGGVGVVEEGGEVRAFATWDRRRHTHRLPHVEAVRVRILAAADRRVLDALLAGLQHVARGVPDGVLLIRTPSPVPWAHQALSAAGFRVKEISARLARGALPASAAGGAVWTDWRA